MLALLFMATPLLRQSRGFQRNGDLAFPRNGQSAPQNGFSPRGNGSQSLPGQDGSNFPNRQLHPRSAAVSWEALPVRLCSSSALLVSLVAAMGMFFTRRWGQVLGIIMAVIYFLIGLISLLPILLIGAIGIRNPSSLILGIASCRAGFGSDRACFDPCEAGHRSERGRTISNSQLPKFRQASCARLGLVALSCVNHTSAP